MDWLDAGMLGLVGALASEALVTAPVLIDKRRWPWRSRRQIAPYVVGQFLKMASSAVFTGALALTGWMPDQAGMYVFLGAVAPAIQQRVSAVAAAVLYGNTPGQGGGDQLG